MQYICESCNLTQCNCQQLNCTYETVILDSNITETGLDINSKYDLSTLHDSDNSELNLNTAYNDVTHDEYSTENSMFDKSTIINSKTTEVKNNTDNNLRILSLNVCGLLTKLHCPEFLSLINDYHLICLQESKLDDLDTISIPGYRNFSENRTSVSRYRSGGITVLVKDEIWPYVQIMKSESKLILWFSISNLLMLNNEELICGVVYIPPIGSKYANPDPYLELQTEFSKFCSNNENVLLLGDFNSRTSALQDFVQLDEFICDRYGNDDLYRENLNIFRYFDAYDVQLLRKNTDSSSNVYGKQLIEFCKNNNIFILNGRIGPDAISPKLTCKNSSTVDYVLSSANNFEFLSSFKVLDFDHLFSDAHCPLSLEIKIHNVGEENMYKPLAQQNLPDVKLWDDSKANKFSENLNFEEINRIESNLKLLSTETVTLQDIDSIVNSIENLFTETSKQTFGFKKKKRGMPQSNCQKINKKWFNQECRDARNTYHHVRRQYNKYKTAHFKNRLKTVSKLYKSVISKNVKQHKNAKISKLRNLKSKNSKDFWKIINSVNSKKQENLPPLNDLYEYFKTLNEDSTGETSTTQPENFHTSNNDLNVSINLPFTENEILTAVKNLKNNKSHGIDGILNEHLKSTIHVMSSIYAKLFNLIFDTGLVPVSWSLGNILPIFKNKGDSKNPENYRPITLLSCFGKLFTSILNSRINKYLDENSTISSCQAGFRKGYSTTDNLFILQSLIEIAKANRNKLYCAFIDFKQAFDKVWRTGLWQKLIDSNINGKCFTFIKNMYKDIKSRISTPEGSSAFFPCQSGIGQGETLSPIMFSLYLNDVEHYLHTHNAPGITCETSNDANYVVFLKLFILLFADDSVLFSNTKEELQEMLNVFKSYCHDWKLTVNTSKTKVVIFAGNRRQNVHKFYFDGDEIEVVTEFKYLGIFLSQSGSYANTKKYIADQANTALFSLLRKIRTLDLPIDLQVELFNKMIKPILLYGCELWGFGNLDVIDRVQLKFFKQILNLKKSTPSYMVYGELGAFPLTVDIQTRMVSFWTKLCDNGKNDIASSLYALINNLNEEKKIKSKWLCHIKNIIASNGFGNIWDHHNEINDKWFVKAFKQKLMDQYLQKWNSLVDNSSCSLNYRIFKETFHMNNYFTFLTNRECKILTKFRTRNHRLPVEIGRWTGIPLNERKCWLCKGEAGDEYHYILKCSFFNNQRKKFVKPYYYRSPNTFKLKLLMNENNKTIMKNLCVFIDHIMRTVRQNIV